jgi:quercetin 2,3-dioxygenase
MIELRGIETMGRTHLGELEAVHHFSFGGYQDLGRAGWGPLSVLNHVRLAPHAERRPQPIDGVDLISVVRKGVIAHRGSLGGSCRTVAGEVQLLCPGPGIVHADINPGARVSEYVEIRLQMNAVPERPQRRITRFPGRAHTGQVRLLASGYPQDRAALPLQSLSRVYAARVPARGCVSQRLENGCAAYVMALAGAISINGEQLDAHGGAAIAEEAELRIEARRFAEFLLIEARK